MTDTSLKYLMIEDNSGDARLIQEMLLEAGGAPFISERVDRLSMGLERLASGYFDVLLLDLALPDSQGLDTFNKVHTQSPQVPVVILTGLDDTSLAYKAVRNGAQDYLVKSQMNSNLLIRSMYYAVERKRAESDITQLNRIIETVRNVDKLIVMEKERDDLLQKTCDTLIDTRGYDAVMIGFLHDENTFTTVLGSGSKDRVSSIREHLISGKYPSCIKNALSRNDPFLLVDKYSECESCISGNDYLDRDTVIIRIRHADKLFGLLYVSLAIDYAIEYEEIELLMEVACDIGLALHDMEVTRARKKAEKELQQANNELKQRVREQTKKLGAMNEELKRSTIALEQFAYTTSHDLEEPLHMVSNTVQLIEQQYNNNRPDTDILNLVGYARDGTGHMQSMINYLHDLSQVSSNGKPFEPVNCEDIVVQVCDDLKCEIEKTGAVITNDSLPTIKMDASQIINLVRCRVENAIKFSNAKKPHIHISSEQNGAEWIFCVRDNNIGCGDYPGSGIGLALGEKIIQRHGGRIWIEPEPGLGTMLYFTIPEVE